MAGFATLVAFITAAATLSTVSAGPVGGPACAAQYKGQPDCVEKCKSSWGFNGRTLGTDRWGPVVLPSGAVDNLNAHIAKACGLTAVPTTAPKPTARIHIPAAANAGGAPIIESLGPAVTAAPSTPISSTSSFSAPTILLVASTTSSTPVAPPPSSSLEPSSSSPLAVPQENEFRPVSPQEPATTTFQAPEPPRTTTTQAPAPPSPPQQTTTRAPAPQPATTAPSSGNGSPGSSTGGARQEWLDAHNAVRARHGASPITWGDDLEDAALKWAQNCIWEHSKGAVGGFGENLSAGTGTHTPTSAVNSWAEEVSRYNPSNPEFSHFTQVVWKATTRIGCATFVCNNNMIPSLGNKPTTYHVCEYDPPGNMAGQFGQNVQV